MAKTTSDLYTFIKATLHYQQLSDHTHFLSCCQDTIASLVSNGYITMETIDDVNSSLCITALGLATHKGSCMPSCLPVRLPVCLPVCLSVCLPACLPACLPVRLPVCQSACLLACLSVCLCLIADQQRLLLGYGFSLPLGRKGVLHKGTAYRPCLLAGLFSSVGRASAYKAESRGFESRRSPLFLPLSFHVSASV